MNINKQRLPIVKIITQGLLPSPIKIWLYKLKGAKIGPRVKIGFGTVVSARESMEIDANTTIGMFSVIECARLRIGKRTAIRPFVLINVEDVSIGDDVTISEIAIIRTLVPSRQSKIVIHNRVHIFPFTLIDPSRLIEIGEESSVGYDTYIFTHGAYKSKLDGYPVEFGEVHIGKRVWIPCRVFIMPSVKIGDDAVIGTGALVNSDIPAGVLAVGTPARAIKTKEQYVIGFSEEKKFLILVDILNEFCQYLQDYVHAIWRVTNVDRSPEWRITFAKGRKWSGIELVVSPSNANCECLSVILQDVPGEMQKTWNSSGKMWFSIGSGQCSEYLDDLGEELREFFKRYGLYFARP